MFCNFSSCKKKVKEGFEFDSRLQQRNKVQINLQICINLLLIYLTIMFSFISFTSPYILTQLPIL